MSTTVARVESSSSSVCYSTGYLKKKIDAARITTFDIQMSKMTMSPGNPFILGQKVKGQGHESQQVSVRLQTEHNVAAGCVRKPCSVFPAAMPHCTSHASNTGFSLCNFPAAAGTVVRD